jgi:hypothetical protein
MLLKDASLNEAGHAAKITWWQAWLTALTQPNLIFYEFLAKNPDITTKRALIWILVGSVIAVYSEAGSIIIYGYQDVPGPGVLLFDVPIVALLVTIVLLTMLGITHAIARSYSKQGTFAELFRPVAAFYAPLMILSGIFSLIPIVRFANYGILVYELGLVILSVKAVHHIGWGKATFSSIAFMLLTFLAVRSAF